eukprot:1128731-Pyramimonas_sp.AAC.1
MPNCLDHALQCDRSDPPLQSAGLHFSASRRARTSVIDAGCLTHSVCIERRQHGGRPAKDDVARRDSANAGEAVAREDRDGVLAAGWHH